MAWFWRGEKDIGQLIPAVPAKGGQNDLSEWKAFGGWRERPAPPAPIIRKSEGQS